MSYISNGDDAFIPAEIPRPAQPPPNRQYQPPPPYKQYHHPPPSGQNYRQRPQQVRGHQPQEGPPRMEFFGPKDYVPDLPHAVTQGEVKLLLRNPDYPLDYPGPPRNRGELVQKKNRIKLEPRPRRSILSRYSTGVSVLSIEP